MLDTHFQIGCKYPSPHVSFFNSGHLWTTAVNVQRQTYHQLCSSVFLVRLCYQTINPILILCILFVNFRNSWRFPGSSLYSLPKVVQSTKDIERFPTWERWRTGEAVWGLWVRTAQSSMSICMSCLSLRLKESESSDCTDCMLRWCKLWEEYQVWRSCQSYKPIIERIEMLLNNWWSFYKIEIGRAHVWTPVTCQNLVCRLLLEKKKKKHKNNKHHKNEIK